MGEILMSLNFSATSVDECLEKASSKLNIPKETLKYRVTKEEKKFFKMRVEIEILDDDENDQIKNEEEEEEKKEKIENVEEQKKVFGAKVEFGKIIITESK